MIKTSLFFLGFAALSVTFSGCATDTSDAESEDGTVLADEQDLTAASGPFKCQGNEDHIRPLTRNSKVRTSRAAAHPELGFDRFVMELERGGDPSSYVIQRQAEPVFLDTGEIKYRVEGDDGLAVIFLGESGDHSAAGPRRIKVANGTAIREVALYEDFEGNVEYGMGVKKNACFRTFTLANPPRLVVDVKR